MELKEYNTKRNFNKTSEPKGKIQKSNSKHIFVIQHHLASRDHFDFRLEWQGVLLSFAVPKGISLNPKVKRLAVKVENHPLDYADFEGVIPKGQYGGGTVMLWDNGTWQEKENFSQGLEKGILKFVLSGKRIKGGFKMVQIKNTSNWLIMKDEDEFSTEKELVYETSVKTNRTMEQIESNQPQIQIDVELAKKVDKLPTEKDWIFEIKYDGYRMVAFVGENTKLMSRNKQDYTLKFSKICNDLNKQKNNMILDGEIIAVDEKGNSNFSMLQIYIKNKNKTPLAYVVFDLLFLNGKDLRNEPLKIRKQKLKENFVETSCLKLANFVQEKGEECLKLACKLGLEGVVAKKLNSLYLGKRSGNWLKIKCVNLQEFVIGGYTLSEKKNGIRAILVGYYENKKLIFAGRVGTGFDETENRMLLEELSKIKTDKSPFEKISKFKNMIFVKPKLVAQIQFAEFTKSGVLRQPSFKGLRFDKNPCDMQKE